MSLKIDLKVWGVRDKGDEGKVISGTYSVKSGNKEVATQDFNGEYGGVKMSFPTALVAEAEALGEKIRVIVETSFTG